MPARFRSGNSSDTAPVPVPAAAVPQTTPEHEGGRVPAAAGFPEAWEERALLFLSGGFLAAWGLSCLLGTAAYIPGVAPSAVRLYRAVGVAVVVVAALAAWRRPLTTLGVFLSSWPLVADLPAQLRSWLGYLAGNPDWGLVPHIGEGPLALALAFGLTWNLHTRRAARAQAGTENGGGGHGGITLEEATAGRRWGGWFRAALWFYAAALLGAIVVGLTWQFSLSASWPFMNILHNLRNFAFASSPYEDVGDFGPLSTGLRNVAPVLFGLALLRLRPREFERRRLLRCLLAGGLVVGFSVLLHYFLKKHGVPFVTRIPFGLYNGFLPHPHAAAPVIVCTLFLLFHCARQRWWFWPPALVGAGLLLWSLGLTGCRGAILLLPVGFAGAVLLAACCRKWAAAAAGTVLLIAVAVTPWLLPKWSPHSRLGERFRAVAARFHRSGTLLPDKRRKIYRTAWQLYESRPVAGIGSGMFAQLVLPETGLYWKNLAPGRVSHAHDMFLQRLVECGPWGALGWLFALLLLPAAAFWRERAGPAAVFFGLLVLLTLMNFIDCSLLFCGVMQFGAALAAFGVWTTNDRRSRGANTLISRANT